jgi:hypothetical protein
MAIIPAPIFVIISSAGYFSRKEVFFAVPTSFPETSDIYAVPSRIRGATPCFKFSIWDYLIRRISRYLLVKPNFSYNPLAGLSGSTKCYFLQQLILLLH